MQVFVPDAILKLQISWESDLKDGSQHMKEEHLALVNRGMKRISGKKKRPLRGGHFEHFLEESRLRTQIGKGDQGGFHMAQ